MDPNPGHRFFVAKRQFLPSRGHNFNGDTYSQVNKDTGVFGSKSIQGLSPKNKIVPLNRAKHILTLQKLANIPNYSELNSKDEDDFVPA
jgi:hypothetical protein